MGAEANPSTMTLMEPVDRPEIVVLLAARLF